VCVHPPWVFALADNKSREQLEFWCVHFLGELECNYRVNGVTMFVINYLLVIMCVSQNAFAALSGNSQRPAN